MFRRSKFRLPIAWALLFAVLFNIALPTLANATRPADPFALGEICSTSGTGAVAVSGERAPASHPDLLHEGHCQFCSVEPVDLLASVLLVPLPGVISFPYPPLRATAEPATPPRTVRPPSHAPPVFS
ncbi:MAG TPA: DUF2946 family protein [Noviherbaspirillum sp.]